MGDEKPKLKAGQVWRLKSGEIVRIAEVSGSDVNGTVSVAGRTTSGRSVHSGVAVWAGRIDAFADADLVGPLYRVSFLFPVSGPQDAVLAALEQIGDVQHRTGARIDSATPPEKGEGLVLSEAEWIVDVVAPDEA